MQKHYKSMLLAPHQWVMKAMYRGVADDDDDDVDVVWSAPCGAQAPPPQLLSPVSRLKMN